MKVPMLFFLKKIIQTLALPPVLPLVLIAAGFALTCRNIRRKTALALIAAGLAISVLVSVPLMVDFMAGQLESIPAVTAEQLKKGEALVILAGGQRGWASEYGYSMPNRYTMERLCYGAMLARKTGLPVLVTGGTPDGGVPESETMATVLRTHFGIEARWLETRSLDTDDNARFSASILKQAGVRTIVLVTHASHMPRAVHDFSEEGLTVIAAPTAFYSDDKRPRRYFGLVPTASAVTKGFLVIHEYAGLLAQRLKRLFS